MKYALLFLLFFIVQDLSAQKTEGVKVISADSLAKYHIGVTKDSNKIRVSKNWTVYSDKMSFWEKCKYFAKLIYDKYPVLSWMLMILVGFWALNLLAKLIGKL